MHSSFLRMNAATTSRSSQEEAASAPREQVGDLLPPLIVQALLVSFCLVVGLFHFLVEPLSDDFHELFDEMVRPSRQLVAAG